MPFRCDIPASPTTQRDDADARITRWDFEPGAVTGFHRHAWPYFVVMLTPGTLRIEVDGAVTDVPLAAGQSYQRAAGIEHDVMNASPHPVSFIEIEVKRPEGLAFLPAA
jgi:quercetin dioxygenase-like cupin family protein